MRYILFFNILFLSGLFCIDASTECEIPEPELDSRVKWSCVNSTEPDGLFCISECDSHKVEHACTDGVWNEPSKLY